MNNRIALFPLPSIVLPEGRLSLRIFEPRYVRMVTEAFKNQRQFGICLPENDTDSVEKLSYFGTLVEIVDFSRMDDGLLGIVAQGVQRFNAGDIQIEEDGLKTGLPELIDDWPAMPANEGDPIVTQWQNFCKNHPEYGDLYSDATNADVVWHCQRWLELLPLEADVVKKLATSTDHQSCYRFLQRILQ